MTGIRPATAADIAQIAVIELDSFADPWSASSFRALLRDPLATITVAEDTCTVVGYAIIRSALDEAEVVNLAVRPPARGRGIGALLLDNALLAAAARGITTMFLEVRESNSAALSLYRSRGFDEVARRRGYYRRPSEDAIVMRCSVGSPGAHEEMQGK